RIALELRRPGWFVTNGILPRQTGAASSKRMLDGALGTEARTRRARLGGRAALGRELADGQPPDGRTCAARCPRKRGRGVWGAAHRSPFGSIGARPPRTHCTKGLTGEMFVGRQRAA